LYGSGGGPGVVQGVGLMGVVVQGVGGLVGVVKGVGIGVGKGVGKGVGGCVCIGVVDGHCNPYSAQQ